MRILVWAVLLLSACSGGSDAVIANPWVRAMPPGSAMTAAYFEFSNRTGSDQTIVAASSDAFELVEIHRTITADGISRMQQQDAVVVAPGETVSFAPQGRHLMLMRPRGTIQPGQVIGFDLHLDDGQIVTFSAEVRQTPK
jgi:copper(I)-binding protein